MAFSSDSELDSSFVSSSASSPPGPILADRYAVEECIGVTSFISVFLLLLLPYETIDGKLVPTIVFKDRPNYFHAFVFGLNFAFGGAFATLALRSEYPALADLLRRISILWMVVAFGLFICFGAAPSAVFCGA